MSNVPTGPFRRSPAAPTANDRMKRDWGAHLAASIVLAVGLHAGALLLWPPSEIRSTVGGYGDAPRLVALAVSSAAPRTHRLAPVPAEIVAPELPTVDDLRLDLPEDVAGPLPDFEETILREPAPPPVLSFEEQWLEYERFAPFLVAPYIRNRTEMRRFLERHYVPILQVTGAQGVVQLQFWIDERGAVSRAEVAQSSGSRYLDRLAVRLSRLLNFSPAMRLGRPVRVLVRLPIAFRER